MQIDFLATLLGTGPLHPIMIGLALLGMVIAVAIWVMEFSGWTITRQGFVKNNVPWNSTSIALLAVSAAIYIVTRPLAINLIPGIGGINPTMALAPTFATLFGLPGAAGVTFSMPIGDAIAGQLTLGSVAGCLSHTFVTWLPYKMVREPNFKVPAAVVSFYFWSIIVAPLIHATVIPGWLDFTHTVPPAVAWGGVTTSILFNHGLTAAIVSPILMIPLYPIVKARGLYWHDRYQPGNSVTKPAAAPAAKTV